MTSAWKTFTPQCKRHGLWQALTKTKDPSTIIVLLGDVGNGLSLILAFIGILIGRLTINPKLDAYVSILIGFLLLVISGFLIQRSKRLLMGESISYKTKRAQIQLARTNKAIRKVSNVSSVYRSLEDAMVMMSTQLGRNISMAELKAAIVRITKKIQTDFLQIRQDVITPV